MELTEKQKEKRRGLALATIPLFLSNGIKNSSISLIAKNADIGKGTIYQYFENKEDIVFEIFDFFNEFIIDKYKSTLTSSMPVKEKITDLLKTIIHQTNEVKDIHPIFVEYYAISLTTDNEEIKIYNRKNFDRFVTIFQSLIKEGLDSGEFQNQKALDLVPIFAAAADGLFFYNEILKDFKDEKNTNDLLKVLFDFLENNPKRRSPSISPYFS